jgi:hypothetical protein
MSCFNVVEIVGIKAPPMTSNAAIIVHSLAHEYSTSIIFEYAAEGGHYRVSVSVGVIFKFQTLPSLERIYIYVGHFSRLD